MNKGDETCCKFLKLLEKKDLQETFPELKKLFTAKQTSAEREGESFIPSTDQFFIKTLEFECLFIFKL